MKKNLINYLAIIFLIGLSLSLSSCAKAKRRLDRAYGLDKSISINEEEREYLLAQKGTFIIYYYSSMCDSCKKSKQEIDALSKDEAIPIRSIDLYDTLLDAIYPSLEIYSQGQLLKRITTFEILNKKERVYYEISRRLSITSLYQILNYSDLKEVISKEKSMILFKLEGCPDCKALDQYFLSDYLYEHQVNLYSFDCKLYPSDMMTYNEFKDEMGLSAKGSEFGYNEGVVPSFAKYESGEIKGLAVFYNDIYIIQQSSFNEIKIISSYYTNSPFINKEFRDRETYYKRTVKFFSEKVKELLNQ